MKYWHVVVLPCSLIGVFLALTAEVRESDAGQMELIGYIDKIVLRFFVGMREPGFNNIATNLTAIGSGTIIVVLVTFCSLLCLLSKNLASLIQILSVSVGAGVLTHILKIHFARPRPEIAFNLVEVGGFSYPSGHSLVSAAVYFSLGLIISRSFSRKTAKYLVISFFLGLVVSIGLTRIYLGVHYLSDVSAGILLGIAWASLVDCVIQLKIRKKSEKMTVVD